jgi:hypothetical protein
MQFGMQLMHQQLTTRCSMKKQTPTIKNIKARGNLKKMNSSPLHIHEMTVAPEKH